jgi:hypothetical protein
MALCIQPDRQKVREWLRQELALHRPPPQPEEVRRQLGWKLGAIDGRSRRGP